MQGQLCQGRTVVLKGPAEAAIRRSPQTNSMPEQKEEVRIYMDGWNSVVARPFARDTAV